MDYFITPFHKSIKNRSQFKDLTSELKSAVDFFSQKDWTPATSSNFSFKIPENDNLIAISRSGVDKSNFEEQDVMIVDTEGGPVWSYKESFNPSAETLIHTTLYEIFDCASVLHTHSYAATVLSKKYASDKNISFSDYELLKGLAGVSDHQVFVEIPILENSQDIKSFSQRLKTEFDSKKIFGFLIAGHGLYTWGKTISEAKRHVEVFEFLFKCKLAEDSFYPYYKKE